MKVFKFGGASVKDAGSVKNIVKVLESQGCEDIFMVISAMGKTTNALEEVVRLYFERLDYGLKLDEIQQNHQNIVQELFQHPESIQAKIHQLFDELKGFLTRNQSPNYDFVYDQVVCLGEMLSTKIVSDFLNEMGMQNTWLDVRAYIKTDATYREGKVDWSKTTELFQQLSLGKFYVTQGFLGADDHFFTTTLGREGSDYTAAIIANCLNAESMTIWKDVPGVLNADPRYFDETILLEKISYAEAIELAYYGASVIHPKTMQPLRQKQIPFYVKSFLAPEAVGTTVENGGSLFPKVPCFIVKKEQHLLTLTTTDFTFITEDKISALFKELSKLKIKVNLMQSSAITLSLCLEDKYEQLPVFMEGQGDKYTMDWEKNVSLYTLRHFDADLAQHFQRGEELLRQTIKNTLQIIVRE